MSEDTCAVRDCYKQARRAGLCWAHDRLKKEGKSLHTEVRSWRTKHSVYESPWVRLQEAAISFNEVPATDANGWERAYDRLRKAALDYAKSRGWRKPSLTEVGEGSLQE